MTTTWMTPDPVVVEVGTTVAASCVLLDTHAIRHLPVVDDGWLVGVLHAADLRAAEPGARVEDLNPQPAPLVSVEAAIEEVLDTLAATNGDVVVVTDGGRPIGVFSEHDVVLRASRILDDAIPLERYLTRPVSTIATTAKVEDARKQLDDSVHRHLVVTLDSRLFGVLSWRDLVDAEPGATVAECVKPLQYRLEYGASCRRAAEQMARHHIGVLPVMKDGELVGIVSRTDILAALRAATS